MKKKTSLFIISYTHSELHENPTSLQVIFQYCLGVRGEEQVLLGPLKNSVFVAGSWDSLLWFPFSRHSELCSEISPCSFSHGGTRMCFQFGGLPSTSFIPLTRDGSRGRLRRVLSWQWIQSALRPGWGGWMWSLKGKSSFQGLCRT